MSTNTFPDGCVQPEKFAANPPAPEELYPPLVGEDLGWVATNATRAKGYQPITSTNPDGDYAGFPLTTKTKTT